VLYEDGPDGLPVVTGLRMSRAGQERTVKADAYVAALDVPGAKKLIPQVPAASCRFRSLQPA
jgi:zeta-carotene desaturase